MQKSFKEEAVLKYCNELTKNGETLKVTWNGGDDSGDFAVLVNDKEVNWSDNRVNEIVRLVHNHIGYGSFAGDFSTDGMLEFSKEDQCLCGTDTYIETRTDTGECKITIALPEDIWFDEVRLHIDNDGYHAQEIAVNLVVNNGPITERHTDLEKKTEESFSAEVEAFVHENSDITGVWYEQTIPSTLFTKKGKTLQHTITELPYNYTHIDESDVTISLN